MNREIFDTYFKAQLASTPQQGDVVILDNLPSQRKGQGYPQAAWSLVPLPAAL
jgi:hypothetical protein